MHSREHPHQRHREQIWPTCVRFAKWTSTSLTMSLGTSRSHTCLPVIVMSNFNHVCGKAGCCQQWHLSQSNVNNGHLHFQRSPAWNFPDGLSNNNLWCHCPNPSKWSTKSKQTKKCDFSICCVDKPWNTFTKNMMAPISHELALKSQILSLVRLMWNFSSLVMMWNDEH